MEKMFVDQIKNQKNLNVTKIPNANYKNLTCPVSYLPMVNQELSYSILSLQLLSPFTFIFVEDLKLTEITFTYVICEPYEYHEY